MGGFVDWLRMRLGWWSSGESAATPTAPKIIDTANFTKTVTDTLNFKRTVTDTLNIGESS